ncbi:MAG TPA: choice-of-anchor tandem repeat GloVer-containing protein [Terriglobales bacterium]|jgi:uncharacterized repeat protein (TIGR03803 family)|nr:choice-of-anchor tandem repeat GloVer-containing protein [Terriglobales bacterium]
MARQKHSKVTCVAFVIAAFVVTASVSWAAPKGKEYKFKGAISTTGYGPSGLVGDGAGNFYGTTTYGGNDDCFPLNPCGTVYKISLGQDGSWNASIIYAFKGGTDGANPNASARLALDSVGNLYGTTFYGGAANAGTVFQLAPNPDGSWIETIIYSFKGGLAGGYSISGVILDSVGNLYGTTNGGTCNSFNACGGTVFELSPTEGGTWTQTTLYALPVGQNQGQSSQPGPVIFDAIGNLYGTTIFGGTGEWGTVFQLIPNQDGSWTENTLYNFTDGLDGGYPSGGVTIDNFGNLYGEAQQGGSFACPESGCGTLYKLSPQSGSNWQFSVVHVFNGLDGSKGNQPSGGLSIDAAGNLYGTTSVGGDLACFGFGDGCGTVFTLKGGATFAILAAFDGTHGAYSQTGVFVDQQENLYGTTEDGGDLNCHAPYGCGVVFELTP